jgi:hypothetical protein
LEVNSEAVSRPRGASYPGLLTNGFGGPAECLFGRSWWMLKVVLCRWQSTHGSELCRCRGFAELLDPSFLVSASVRRVAWARAYLTRLEVGPEKWNALGGGSFCRGGRSETPVSSLLNPIRPQRVVR